MFLCCYSQRNMKDNKYWFANIACLGGYQIRLIGLLGHPGPQKHCSRHYDRSLWHYIILLLAAGLVPYTTHVAQHLVARNSMYWDIETHKRLMDWSDNIKASETFHGAKAHDYKIWFKGTIVPLTWLLTSILGRSKFGHANYHCAMGMNQTFFMPLLWISSILMPKIWCWSVHTGQSWWWPVAEYLLGPQRIILLPCAYWMDLAFSRSPYISGQPLISSISHISNKISFKVSDKIWIFLFLKNNQ